jgi:hypothetical protein
LDGPDSRGPPRCHVMLLVHICARKKIMM